MSHVTIKKTLLIGSIAMLFPHISIADTCYSIPFLSSSITTGYASYIRVFNPTTDSNTCTVTLYPDNANSTPSTANPQGPYSLGTFATGSAATVVVTSLFQSSSTQSYSSAIVKCTGGYSPIDLMGITLSPGGNFSFITATMLSSCPI